MSTAHATYSTPRVTRSTTEAIIDFDIVTPERTAWDTIRLNRGEDGTITILDRGTAVGLANVTIPAPILPVVLAEIDRLVTADDLEPFAPIPAVSVRHVIEDHHPGITEPAATIVFPPSSVAGLAAIRTRANFSTGDAA